VAELFLLLPIEFVHIVGDPRQELLMLEARRIVGSPPISLVYPSNDS